MVPPSYFCWSVNYSNYIYNEPYSYWTYVGPNLANELGHELVSRIVMINTIMITQMVFDISPTNDVRGMILGNKSLAIYQIQSTVASTW